MNHKPFSRACTIQSDFLKLGFWGIIAFKNVCKSIDAGLNGFDIMDFWFGKPVDEDVLVKLESIIEVLKNE